MLTFTGSGRLSAEDPTFDPWRLALIPTGETVFDVVNRVTWLADANLPAHRRFGIPLCDGSGGMLLAAPVLENRLCAGNLLKMDGEN